MNSPRFSGSIIIIRTLVYNAYSYIISGFVKRQVSFHHVDVLVISNIAKTGAGLSEFVPLTPHLLYNVMLSRPKNDYLKNESTMSIIYICRYVMLLISLSRNTRLQIASVIVITLRNYDCDPYLPFPPRAAVD